MALVSAWQNAKVAAPGCVWQVPLAQFGGLIWPTLVIDSLARLFLPHLIYRQSSKLWECGNREAISKGGGKGGKPDFGFPGFPRTVISTAWPISLQLGSLLLFFRGSAEAIGFCSRLQDVSSIGDSIQQRFAESRVRDDLRPLGKR